MKRFSPRFWSRFLVDFKGGTTAPLKSFLQIFSVRYLVGFSLAVALLICCSCGSTKSINHEPLTINHQDTIYLNSQQYDSIYIFKELNSDYRRGIPSSLNSQPSTLIDTLYIKDKSIEYRYKLLRDTVKVIQRDSIPYEVTVIETKEITRPLTWFDKTCRACFFLLLGAILFCLIRFIRVRL